MSRLYNILNEFVASSESLATGATLIRQGRKRTLVLNKYVLTANNFTIPSGDRPSAVVRGTGILYKVSTSDRNISMSFFNVNTDGTVAFYYFPNYNSSGAGIATGESGNQVIMSAEWLV